MGCYVKNKAGLTYLAVFLCAVLLAGVLLTLEMNYQRAKDCSQGQFITGADEAVGAAVRGRMSSYGRGEVATEGHIILDYEEEDGRLKFYTLASYGAFAFENGIFTKVSGSGAIPTVITLEKNEAGGYKLLEYNEPMDGAGYLESVKEMFPRRLHNAVLSGGKSYSDLTDQQEKQASEYLKSIGRDAPVSAAHVNKVLANINVEASNKLFTEFTKHDEFLNSCPYWLGTIEKIEDGVRYIYATLQSKTEDGLDLIIFQKKTEDGTVEKEGRYKIVGSEPQLID